MKTIHATVNGKKYTFRTNDNGYYLFMGSIENENRQIDCGSGFDSLRRIKRAIREHLRYVYGCDIGNPELPRIKYDYGSWETWKK